jgi:hypothetical protein
MFSNLSEMDITPFVLVMIFAFGFIAVAYDQIALSRGWMIKPWMRGNSFMKLSGVFSIFMAPALAFHLLPWWVSIFVVVVGCGCFFLLVAILRKHAQLSAVAGLAISWAWIATHLVQS